MTLLHLRNNNYAIKHPDGNIEKVDDVCMEAHEIKELYNKGGNLIFKGKDVSYERIAAALFVDENE
jgi:hypothetical protein